MVLVLHCLVQSDILSDHPKTGCMKKMKGLHIENTIDEQKLGEQIVMAQTKQIEAEMLE